MARPQKHTSSPFFKLRQILGLNQMQLAELIGASFAAIQSVESGRLNLSSIMLDKVRFATGALWNESKRLWVCDRWALLYLPDGADESTIPFTPELYRKYQELISVPISDKTREQNSILMLEWLRQLLERIPSSSWMVFWYRFSRFIETTAQEFEVERPEELFQAAQAKHATDFQAYFQKELEGKSIAEILLQAIKHLKAFAAYPISKFERTADLIKSLKSLEAKLTPEVIKELESLKIPPAPKAAAGGQDEQPRPKRPKPKATS